MHVTCMCMHMCTFFRKVDPNPALGVHPPWRHFCVCILYVVNYVINHMVDHIVYHIEKTHTESHKNAATADIQRAQG